MWFVCALITFFAWGGADLFYKKGNDADEQSSHLLTSVAVGLVMGVTAIVTLLVGGFSYDFRNLLVYLPVSAAYILSMTVGYFGLRYLAVSVSSPVQNASGAVSALLLMAVLRRLPDFLSGIGIIMITAGVILLGVSEYRADKKSRPLQPSGERRMNRLLVFTFPIAYCVIDSLGTFLDGYYLDDVSTTPLIGVTEDTVESVANVSYQLTFLFVALVLLVYIRFIKRQKIRLTRQGSRFAAALLETAGQFTYVYAMSGNGIVASPVISAYCGCSVVFGRIFLREKLTAFQYVAVSVLLAGIVLIGVSEGLA